MVATDPDRERSEGVGGAGAGVELATPGSAGADGSDRQRGVEGLELAITGRLASMRRDEATRRIEEGGGIYAASPTRSTHLLVIGQGGPPLGDDGLPTKHLRTARRLRDEGVPIQIIGEDEFLARLGLDDRQDDLHRVFTTAQLARILGISQGEIRSWVRHDLIEPVKVVRRLCFFDFRQVAGAKALSRLTADGVRPQRIRRSLMELLGWWPESEAALAQLETLEQNDALFVRTREGSLAETSGQLRLDFDAPVAPAAAPRPIEERAPDPESGSEELWFRRGLQLEEEDRGEEAVVAYAKALEFGNPRPELAFNLGNLMYGLERTTEAAQCFALATEIEPEYVEAWNNLGNALSEMDQADEAIDAFEKALQVEPDYPDAHFNLAETLATSGRTEEAREHWLAYLELDPHSSSADEVRARLRRTERG